MWFPERWRVPGGGKVETGTSIPIGDVVDERRRWNLSATKLPRDERTVAHSVLTDDDDRGYLNIRGADDSGTSITAAALGETVVYSVLLTDAEADQFREAENLIWIEPDQTASIPDPVETQTADGDTTATLIPSDSARRFMGAAIPGWRGDGVKVAILDGGVGDLVLTAIGCQRVAARNFSGVPTSDGTTAEHGCWVASCALTDGMLLIDAIICDRAGNSTHSASAAAMIWAVDQGAQIVNYSSGASFGSRTMEDAVRLIGERGAVLVASAGNEGRTDGISYPAAYFGRYPHVMASIAFDDTTGTVAPFSNRVAEASGCAPGVRVLAYDRDGTVKRVSGTSFSGPHQLWELGRTLTGGRWTPIQAAAAFIGTARDTGAPPADQGRGAWDMQAAIERLEHLERTESPPPVVDPEKTPEPPPLRATDPTGCLGVTGRALRGMLSTQSRGGVPVRRDRIVTTVAALGLAAAGVAVGRATRPAPLLDTGPRNTRERLAHLTRKWR